MVSEPASWADITVGGYPVHFVTTHLEEFWARDAEPAMAAQARVLVTDLQAITIPIVAMGDLNVDPVTRVRRHREPTRAVSPRSPRCAPIGPEILAGS